MIDVPSELRPSANQEIIKELNTHHVNAIDIIVTSCMFFLLCDQLYGLWESVPQSHVEWLSADDSLPSVSSLM